MRKQIIVLTVGALLAHTGWTRDKSEDPKAHPDKEQSIGLGFRQRFDVAQLAGDPGALAPRVVERSADRFHHERVTRSESSSRRPRLKHAASLESA
jgi:hypothetical protein